MGNSERQWRRVGASERRVHGALCLPSSSSRCAICYVAMRPPGGRVGRGPGWSPGRDMWPARCGTDSRYRQWKRCRERVLQRPAKAPAGMEGDRRRRRDGARRPGRPGRASAHRRAHSVPHARAPINGILQTCPPAQDRPERGTTAPGRRRGDPCAAVSSWRGPLRSGGRDAPAPGPPRPACRSRRAWPGSRGRGTRHPRTGRCRPCPRLR